MAQPLPWPSATTDGQDEVEESGCTSEGKREGAVNWVAISVNSTICVPTRRQKPSKYPLMPVPVRKGIHPNSDDQSWRNIQQAVIQMWNLVHSSFLSPTMLSTTLQPLCVPHDRLIMLILHDTLCSSKLVKCLRAFIGLPFFPQQHQEKREMVIQVHFRPFPGTKVVMGNCQ
ncbi:hypothetical protein BDZ97DRAFT_1762539 [Flammula alnicola]|nr:hypothetical protein BDZ97DRAFT_1762539 [Flammula alnicola]